MARTFDTVAVLGTGVLGSQIIMQAAWHGKKVFAYDAVPEALEKLDARWEWIRAGYREDLDDYSDEKFAAALERVTPTSDLAEAVGDVDIVIESIPEDLDLKKETWEKVGAVVADRALLATNTSSLLPSLFADSSGSPERFLAIHYANRIWDRNLNEVMGTEKTDQEAIDDALRYAEETGMVSVLVRKETPGYLLNSLLIPWLQAGANLYMNGSGTPEEIDNAWKIALGHDQGPFQVYDLVGFNVASLVAGASEQQSQRDFAELLKASIAEGRTGIADGEGFYRYNSDGEIVGAVERWNEKFNKQ